MPSGLHRHSRQHLVGQTGDRILFMHHQRLAQQRCHHAAGKRGVTAETGDHGRLIFADQPMLWRNAFSNTSGSVSQRLMPLPRMPAISRISSL